MLIGDEKFRVALDIVQELKALSVQFIDNPIHGAVMGD